MRLLQGRVNPAANYVSGPSRVCLLYLLGLEHVDNLGAYCIPSETGLLPRKQLQEAVG